MANITPPNPCPAPSPNSESRRPAEDSLEMEDHDVESLRARTITSISNSTSLPSVPFSSPRKISTPSRTLIPKAMARMPSPPSSSESAYSQEQDIFASSTSAVTTPAEPVRIPQSLDDLPASIRLLANDFITSITGKATNLDDLVARFERFYVHLDSVIELQKLNLKSRQHSPTSIIPNPWLLATSPPSSSSSSPTPSPSFSSKALTPQSSLHPISRSQPTPKATAETPLLTVSELHAQRQDTRLLFQHPTHIGEIVEKTVCERLYGQIYNPPASNDATREKMLRERIAKLQSAGFGLKQLFGSDDQQDGGQSPLTSSQFDMLTDSLQPAVAEIRAMDQEHSPLGKLHRLLAASKLIVHALTATFSSRGSADDIFPALVYAVIVIPPEGVNIVSNASFIRRFRARNRLMDGPEVYWLVNLEAVIALLESDFVAKVLGLSHSDLQTQDVRPLFQSFNPAAFLTNTVRDGADHVFDALSMVFRTGRTVLATSIPKTLDDALRFITRQPPPLIVQNDILLSPKLPASMARDFSENQPQPNQKGSSATSSTSAILFKPLDISRQFASEVGGFLSAPTQVISRLGPKIPGLVSDLSTFAPFNLVRGGAGPAASAQQNQPMASASRLPPTPTHAASANSREIVADADAASDPNTNNLPHLPPLPASNPAAFDLDPLAPLSPSTAPTSISASATKVSPKVIHPESASSELRFENVRDVTTLNQAELQLLLDEYHKLLNIVRGQD